MAFLTDEEQKLDEAQGISVDEIRMWLERKGWNTGIGRLYRKQRNDGSYCYVSTTNELSSALSEIASEEGTNLPAVLREINPRMRKGWPSERALAVHQMWIVSTRGSLSIGRYVPVSRELFSDGKDIWCWPCDNHGNKVRWPVNADGEML